VVRHRVRIRFGKQGDLRLLGHRDLMRCFERWFRRAGLRLRMSEGFHPKPRMNFPSALAVGVAAENEVMEIELAETYSAEEVLAQLRSCAPPGLPIRSVEVRPPGSRKVRVCSVCYELSVPQPGREGLATRIDRLMASRSHLVRRGDRERPVDVRPALEALTLREGLLQMRLDASSGAAGPRDVLTALELSEILREGVTLTRSSVEVSP
jgi:radical SAM-linked protein